MIRRSVAGAVVTHSILPNVTRSIMPSRIVVSDAGAAFSSCRRWRYLLWRRWDGARPAANFLMLNPSTADETKLDPTCARAREYARRWGYGALSAYELKILQECITLLVFMGFAWLALGETPQLKHAVSFALIVAAFAVAFHR
mgnify:CR=1 FL=1